MGREGETDLHRMNKMSEEKKNEVTEVVKEEARELTEKELAQVSGGLSPDIESADRNSKGYIPLGA